MQTRGQTGRERPSVLLEPEKDLAARGAQWRHTILFRHEGKAGAGEGQGGCMKPELVLPASEEHAIIDSFRPLRSML